MSTTAQIGILRETRTATLIEVASDGYPDYMKPLLKDHYNTLEKVKELLANGNLMYLDETLKASPKDTVITTIGCLQFVSSASDIDTGRLVDYQYIFKEEDTRWYIIDNGEFKPL
ncbi:hypothetical protein [Streptococcus cuniculi]|uniref:Uncharacterized protein n=1 Tax=Streptococcus cuniculi TaxID=1432788 RepID=A0A4Y9J8Y2_9STRE|nr:hypothetical protein [Streptococcus cuniculi]MBF0778718.1 hypothetical protein [Streptococcus cuniculi]TFU97352.1 hypothetical protein E4T82_08290 [Streptococcus cuniculi]